MDSLNVGYWIQGKSTEYKPFVAHCVGEIHENSNPDQWRYVPTSLNPADLGTRGMTALELTESKKWWNGPDFLRCPAAEWPDPKFDKPLREALTELKSTSRQNTESSTSYNVIQLSTTEGEEETDKFEDALWHLHPSRYSKWYKVKPKGELEVGLSLVRVRSWVERFVRNCCSPADQRELGELTQQSCRELKRILSEKLKMKHSVMKLRHWVGVSPFRENPRCSLALQSLSTGSFVRITGCDTPLVF